jgi:hypothetical protein
MNHSEYGDHNGNTKLRTKKANEQMKYEDILHKKEEKI